MAALDIVSGRSDGTRLFATVYLDQADLTCLADAPAPSEALAALILALPGAGAVAAVARAVACRTAWRLQRKNKRFGYRGLRIVFMVATNIATVPRAVAYTLSTVRIREPDLDWSQVRITPPSISVTAMTPTIHR